ncbi:hypothetical protein GCM10027615_17410 [Plantactinospora veratri]
MRRATERQQMVLAEAHHVDVPDEYEFLVVGLEGGGEHLGRVDPEPGEEFGVRPGDPGRRLDQTVPVRVLADGDQDLPDRLLDPGQVDGVLDRPAAELAVDQPGGEVVQLVVRLGG